MKLTELEKTILVSLYVITQGSTRKAVEPEALTNKFPMRQRKMVRKYIKELIKKGLIDVADGKYRMNTKSVRRTSKILVSGFRARF